MLKRICITAGVVYAFGGVCLDRAMAQPPAASDSQVQNSQSPDSQTPPDDAAPLQTLPAPLSLEQKYLFTLNQVFSPGAMALYNFRSGVDEVLHKHAPWGSEGSYGLHTASFLGRSFLRQNLAFGVRAIDHEDPRYFVLGHGSGWTRVKYAVARTFLARSDRGGDMPAYSLFVAAYGTPLLADRWGLEHFLNPHPFRAGTAGIGIAAGSDIFQEFWPDLKKKLDLDERLHRLRRH